MNEFYGGAVPFEMPRQIGAWVITKTIEFRSLSTVS